MLASHLYAKRAPGADRREASGLMAGEPKGPPSRQTPQRSKRSGASRTVGDSRFGVKRHFLTTRGVAGRRPSRCNFLRASLRARRTASAASRARFSEGFS